MTQRGTFSPNRGAGFIKRPHARDPEAEAIARAVAAEKGMAWDVVTGTRQDQQVVAVRRAIIRAAHAEGHNACSIARVIRCDSSSVRHHLRKMAGGAA